MLGMGAVKLPWDKPARFRYHPLPDLPGQQAQANPGVAGAFAGVSNGALLLAGGANFPNGYPWQNGTKVWQTTVYALLENGRQFQWLPAGALAKPLAYGASVVWNEQLICIGGNDVAQRHAEVFTLRWDAAAKQVQTGALPSLPLALANQAAAVLDQVLYVFGGESNHGTEKSLFVLDLQNPAAGWHKRADLPGPARAFSTLVAQGSALYVLGGRETSKGTTTMFQDAYLYQPQQDTWAALPALPVPLAAHSSIADGASSLLIFGGDDGVRLQQIEALNRQLGQLPDGPEKAALVRKRNDLQSIHPGFRREVWEFRTDTKSWVEVGKLPFATPVTTPTVRWGQHLIIPSGEVSPGIRTPGSWQITVGKSS